MKKCPFCAEEIQDAAVKCRYCGSMLDQILAAPVGQPATVPYDEFEDVRKLARLGRKVEAITLLRDKTGWGLKEAEGFVDKVPLWLHKSDRVPEWRPDGHQASKTFGCLVVILLTLGIAVAYFSAGEWLNRVPPPASRQTAPVAEPAIDVSATDLVQAYQDNEVAADQRFKGRTLLVSGTIDSIGRDVLNTPFITFRSSGFRRVQAMFARPDEGRLAALSKGSHVSIQGRCGGMFGNILIKDAVLR